MKKIITSIPFIFLALSSNATPINIQPLKDNPDVLNNIQGIKITDFGYQSKNAPTNKEQQLKQAQEQANSSVVGAQLTESTPATPVNGLSIPSAPNVEKPKVITPQNAAIPIPQNYMDIQQQSQSQTPGQTLPEPLKFQPMNVQTWNNSTINELESKGNKNGQQNYQNFRRGIQY